MNEKKPVITGNLVITGFCVNNEPSRQACLHPVVCLANIHHRADKRDGVRSIKWLSQLYNTLCQIIVHHHKMTYTAKHYKTVKQLVVSKIFPVKLFKDR